MLLNHGVIGNGRLLALVNPDTSIDWLCMPRFDSASVFARLLDEEKGGTFAFVADGMRTRMAYARNTNVLRTEVEVPDGRFEIYDFAPRIPLGLSVEAPLEIHRLIRPLAGAPRISARIRPAPDYARVKAEFVPIGAGLEIRGGPTRLFLRSNIPSDYIESGFPFRVDRPLYFVLSSGRPTEVDSTASVDRALELTIAGWRQWANRARCRRLRRGRAALGALSQAARVQRTGAIIAAAPHSIPESLDSVAPGTIAFAGCATPQLRRGSAASRNR